MLQPREHPLQIEGADFKSQTRFLKRKSSLVKAPTGQMSTVFKEYELSRVFPGKGRSSTWSPRWTKPSSEVFDFSSQKRTQREHMMQRSSSSMTRGPKGNFLGLWTFP